MTGTRQRIGSAGLLVALALACAGACSGSALAQEAEGASPDDFDLGAARIDSEALLVTNAAEDDPQQECIPSDDPDKIVVCARDPMQYRIDSSLDEATRNGEAARDGMPRAPEFAPSCRNNGGGACIRVGPEPYRPLLIDLDAIPEPLPAKVAEKVRFALTPEELATVRREAGLDDAPAGDPAAAPDP